jgi:thiol-disulfide isomerase/thioredoxin
MNRLLKLLIFLAIGYGLWSISPFAGNPVGMRLPPVVVQYLPPGEPYTLGQPAVIEFWATWCPPCRDNIPRLNGLKRNGADLGLQVIGISSEDEKVVNEFRRGVSIEYTLAVDPGNRMAQHFKVTSVPYAILVDRLGKVRWAGHPADLSVASIREKLQ